jgi:sugar transferase EpsL
MTAMPHPFYRSHGKRWLDLALTGPALLLLAPLFALIALAVRLRLGTPILFRQVRPGRRGEPFTLLKFRTMTSARDESGTLLPDAQRLTPLGRALRRASLDELPELWNVLRGEMSLVGPRPLLPQYLARYSPEQAQRHEVEPGITGWAQIHGRNALAWQQKFALDVWYVAHVSLSLDLKIVALTLPRIFSRAGITSPGHATADEFLGNE